MWYVYIIQCKDKSLYTGFTNDLEKRFKRHKSGEGAKYTMSHKPEKIIYFEKFEDKTSALKREGQIKGWSHDKKIKFIESQNKPG